MSYRSKYDRVLVVDDDRALGEMLAIVLDGEGLNTRIVRTGDIDTDVLGLLLRQLSQLDTQRVEVQPGDLLVQVLATLHLGAGHLVGRRLGWTARRLRLRNLDGSPLLSQG